MKRRILTIVAVSAIAVAGVTGTAAAGSSTTVGKTKVKLSYSDQSSDPYGQSAFKGKVKGKKGCSASRKVKIKGIGKAKTDSKGNFSIAKTAPKGTYVAKVKKKTLHKGGKTVKCARAKSNKVTVS